MAAYDKAPMISNPTQIGLDVDRFLKEWSRYRDQKHRQRGGVEARILLNLCLYFGEQYAQQSMDSVLTRAFTDDAEKNRLRLIFNLTRRATKRKLGRIWGVSHEFYATPDIKDPRAYDRADVVNKAIKATDRVLQQQALFWSKLFWMAVGGVAIEHSHWIPDAVTLPMPMTTETGELVYKDLAGPPQPDGSPALVSEAERQAMVAAGMPPERFAPYETLKWEGEIGGEVISPLNFFIDNACLSIRGPQKGLSPDQGCYIAQVKTAGWVGEVFGSDARTVIENAPQNFPIVQTVLQDRGPTFANLNMRDLIPAVNGSRGKDDPPMALFLTRYQPPHEGYPYGRCSYIVPGVGAQGMLDDGEIPYTDIPLTDTHWEPQATCFFGGDFVTDLVAPQKFLNKRMSQLGEAANASLYEVLLLGPELDKDDIPTDMPGVVPNAVSPEGIPLVQALQRAGVQGWFVESIRMVVEMFEMIASSDITNAGNKFKYQRGTMGLPVLQEIHDSEDGPFYSHLGEQEASIRQQRINRMQEYYPAHRTLRFTGSDLRDEVLDFYTDDILRAGYDFAISIDQGTLLPELSAMREEKINRRLASPVGWALYTNRRTGKLDPSKIASDLKYTDRNRESREEQARKLARQLISKVMDGKLLAAPTGVNPQNGQPMQGLFQVAQDGMSLAPFELIPVWDHDVMLDEYEAVMTTMEFLEQSSLVRMTMSTLYESQRGILAQMHAAAEQSMMNQAVQRSVAMATQQAAAMASAATVDESREQLMQQGAADDVAPVEDQLRRLMTTGKDAPPQGSRAFQRQPPRVH